MPKEVKPSTMVRRLLVLGIAVVMKTRYNWENKDCVRTGLRLIDEVEGQTGGSITEGLDSR